jgi:hypothetical protein
MIGEVGKGLYDHLIWSASVLFTIGTVADECVLGLATDGVLDALAEAGCLTNFLAHLDIIIEVLFNSIRYFKGCG